MKFVSIFTLILIFNASAFSQETFPEKQGRDSISQSISYAYVLIHGKLFSKKLDVKVDLGDTPQQMKAGKEYSEKLTNKKSYAAVLNYMVDQNFELVETLDYTYTYSGTGGTSGIVFVMRKRLNIPNSNPL